MKILPSRYQPFIDERCVCAVAPMGKRGREAQAGMARYSLFLRRNQLERLRAVQKAQGVPVAEQIRRAIDGALGTRPARKGGRA